MKREIKMQKRNGEIVTVLETTERAESSYGHPVYVLDGEAYTLVELGLFHGLIRILDDEG